MEEKLSFWSTDVRKGFMIPIALAFVLWGVGFGRDLIRNMGAGEESKESFAKRLDEQKTNLSKLWDKYNEVDARMTALKVDTAQVTANAKDIGKLEAQMTAIEGRIADSRETNAAQSEAIHKLQAEQEPRRR